MNTSANLILFGHVVQRPEEEIDLGQAALLLGEIPGSEVDVSAGLSRLHSLGEQAKLRCQVAREPSIALARFLFEELAFRGNEDDYYNPENSFLGAVLEQRLGIPISLSVLMIEIGRRAGVPVEGVNFPGNFLVRVPVSGGYLFFDPYTKGQILSRAGLKTLYKRTTGQDKDPEADVLGKITKRQLILRMLQNLRSIYTQRNDKASLRGVLERVALLEPNDETLAKELASIPKKPISFN
jgi:regulator of sirC expression with transglutaminase-like and TPR domain